MVENLLLFFLNRRVNAARKMGQSIFFKDTHLKKKFYAKKPIDEHAETNTLNQSKRRELESFWKFACLFYLLTIVYRHLRQPRHFFFLLRRAAVTVAAGCVCVCVPCVRASLIQLLCAVGCWYTYWWRSRAAPRCYL